MNEFGSKLRELDQRHSGEIDDIKRQIQELLSRMRGLEGRVEAIENIPPPIVQESNSHDIEDLMQRVKDLEANIKDKVDCDMFDNEIAALREMIGNIEPDETKPIQVTSAPSGPPKVTGPQFSTKDMNRIKELLEKFPGMEESIGKITK